MAKHNHIFFYSALVLTIVIHLLAINPISKWLDREILPALSDESLVIDLSEIKTHPDSIQNKKKIENQSPIQTQPESSDKPKQKEEKILIPTTKKDLDPTLTEDQVASSKKESSVPPQKPSVKQKSDPTELKENSQSPLFIRKPQKETKEKVEQSKKKATPKEIKETFRNDKPEATDDEKLEYSMNSYKWTFQRYAENWAVDIQKWWKAPLDYAMGNVPEGGDMWIEVKIAKTGKLLGYRIKGSNITAEMELRVIQALVGSLARPALPESFPKEWLLINWHFIYPPVRPQLQMRR